MFNVKKIVIFVGILLIAIAALATALSLIVFPRNQSMMNADVAPYSGKSLFRDGDMQGGISGGDMASEKMMPESLTYESDSAVSAVDKKVIKNGSISLKVNKVDAAYEKISKIASDNGGEIFSSSFYQSGSGDTRNGHVIVRVPVANFEKAFLEIKKTAALVVSESTSGQDITEEYADFQAQLKNKQAEEQQFLQIMSQAQKIQDILDVTRELSRVRGEIEQLQGRIKYLSSQADSANIFVSLSEDANVVIDKSWRPFQEVKDAAKNLIKRFQGFINFVIVLVITVIPIAALYLILAFAAYKIGLKIYQKFKQGDQD